MAFTLENIVPWGRSCDEYVRMFALTEEDLSSRILGCGDGPASFNAVLSGRGGHVVSVDPLYAFDEARIRGRIDETYEIVMAETLRNRESFVWDAIPSPEALGALRMSAMKSFLADFESGKREGRYVAAELPSLPFEDRRFDLGLCSHFLFLYSAHLSAEFHLSALREMLRVARQVRVFPLLTLDGRPSPHLASSREGLAESGFAAAVRRVPYEFQRGGNEMLVVTPSA
jgi:hypothetical protein